MNKSIFLFFLLVIFTMELSSKNKKQNNVIPGDSLLVDIFPLSIGNQWIYNYSYYTNDQTIGMLTENGTIKIDIINKISKTDSIIWKAKFTNDILYKYQDGYTYRDTSIDTLNIIEDLNGFHNIICGNH